MTAFVQLLKPIQRRQTSGVNGFFIYQLHIATLAPQLLSSQDLLHSGSLKTMNR